MVLILEGSVIEVKDEHPKKALFPTSLILAGKIVLRNSVQF
jgi:hypothetical protein